LPSNLSKTLESTSAIQCTIWQSRRLSLYSGLNLSLSAYLTLRCEFWFTRGQDSSSGLSRRSTSLIITRGLRGYLSLRLPVHRRSTVVASSLGKYMRLVLVLRVRTLVFLSFWSIDFLTYYQPSSVASKQGFALVILVFSNALVMFLALLDLLLYGAVLTGVSRGGDASLVFGFLLYWFY